MLQLCSRSRTRAGLLAIGCLIGVIGLSGIALTANEKYSIAAIHARFYFEGTGELGANELLDGEEHLLLNTIIGEGEAGKPSSVTWLQVDLSGPTFVDAPGRLEVRAAAKGKLLLNQTVELGTFFGETNELVLPFLVYATGCEPLEITATLKGIPVTKLGIATLKKSVPFRCEGD